ncbi:hypothetical protein [Candidatus Avelusimicrobium sp.]|uniref:hypothetical protein n=1 Tax=Candidatus Avelusimicrobium sp. TaxID=3048833 RepID=UPI003D7D53F8
MKKYTFLTFAFLLTVLVPASAEAQVPAVSRGARAATQVSKASAKAVSRLPSAALPTNVKIPSAVTFPTVPVVPSTPALPRVAPTVPANVSGVSSKSQLQEALSKLQQLQQENLRLKNILATEVIPKDAYIFQAVESEKAATSLNGTNIFSGTVVSIPYNGKNEVYGVIATHAIATSSGEKDALHKTFTAIVYKNGLPHEATVEVVAYSPKSMLDMALVKFPADIEPLLAPYSISAGAPYLQDNLLSKGFTHSSAAAIPERQVVGVTPISIRTTISMPAEKRPGLCGSAVLNDKGELVGIHTGSVHNAEDPGKDVAYATHAHYLYKLVEAYHNNGVAKIPFYFDDKPIFDMDIDEYLTAGSLLDENKKAIKNLTFESKFSYSKIKKAIADKPEGRYLQLTTRRALWDKDGQALIEGRTSSDHSIKTTYVYDLQEHKLIKKRQAVYNPATRRVDKIDVPLD